MDINKTKNNVREDVRVECPECGYIMPYWYTDQAECNGVMFRCKGRKCHAVFELKIEKGKQIK